MLKTVVVLLVVIVLLTTGAMGQSTFGELIGVVKDPGQGLVPSAVVTLTSVEEKDEYSAASDADGLFHFVNLKPGHYNLMVKAVGFADYRVSSLQLEARQSLRLYVPLKLATNAQTVEVTGDSGPVIDTENGVIADSKEWQHASSRLSGHYRPLSIAAIPPTRTIPQTRAVRKQRQTRR